VEEGRKRLRQAREAERNQREADARLQAAAEADLKRYNELQRKRQLATRPTAATGQNFAGKCVGVSDGDTISVMHDGRAEKIRLYGIDCPESAQPFGTKAKQFASAAVFGKNVKVYVTGTDRYKRTLGWVFEGKQCLNRDLVGAGLAWHYNQYAPKEAKLASLEVDARKAGRGLWSDCCAVAPWEWRRGKREATPRAKPAASKLSATEGAGDSGGSVPFDWHILVPIGFVASVAWWLYRPRRA